MPQKYDLPHSSLLFAEEHDPGSHRAAWIAFVRVSGRLVAGVAVIVVEGLPYFLIPSIDLFLP